MHEEYQRLTSLGTVEEYAFSSSDAVENIGVTDPYLHTQGTPSEAEWRIEALGETYHIFDTLNPAAAMEPHLRKLLRGLHAARVILL